jgi:hypothetical protein
MDMGLAWWEILLAIALFLCWIHIVVSRAVRAEVASALRLAIGVQEEKARSVPIQGGSTPRPGDPESGTPKGARGGV